MSYHRSSTTITQIIIVLFCFLHSISRRVQNSTSTVGMHCMLTMHMMTYLLMPPGTHMYLVLLLTAVNGICQSSDAAAMVLCKNYVTPPLQWLWQQLSHQWQQKQTIETMTTTKLLSMAKSTLNNKRNYCYFAEAKGK